VKTPQRSFPFTRWYGERSIGFRLAVCFGVILSLMTLGSAVAFWQLRATIAQAERLQQVDRMAEDVLRLHTDVLTLSENWHETVSTQQIGRLVAVSEASRTSLTSNIDRAMRTLSVTPADAENHASILVTLQTLRIVLVDQIDAMVRLAHANEWQAVRRRLDNEVRRSIEVTRGLVQDIDLEVEKDQRAALVSIRRVQARATLVLAITGLLTLVMAALLGIAVTRSITGPLAHLDAATKALARGNFQHHVAVTGHDQLANVGRAFNEAAARLRNLYDALQRSETQYRLFFEMDLSGNYVSTPDGRLLACNPAFARMFGFNSVEEAMRSNMVTIYRDPVGREAFLDTLKRDKQIELHEDVLRKKDGSALYVIDNAVGVFDKQGELMEIRGYLLDNTVHRRSEDELRQSQKLEAVGRLAGGIAHDFNNLLTAIVGYSETVLERVSPTDTTYSQVLQIRKAGERAAALTRQLLIFSRKHVVQPRIVDLNEIVGDMYSLLRRLIGEDISIVVRADATIGRVKADPVQVEQLIMNLGLNARDAMPRGGTLTLETANVIVAAGHERAGEAVPTTPGQYVMLAISDNGVGMDAETKSHLFEPFFTTKPVGKGTGLGLSTVYGIVRESGGEICVRSEPGQGAEWRIFLPRVDEIDEAVTAISDVGAQLRGTETVLLVEDEASVRALESAVLRTAGYTVFEAGNGDEALRLSKEHRHRIIHLLVTDVVMPQLGGKELARRLSAERPEIKVLFMSGYLGDVLGDSDTHARGHFLPKPFPPRVLLQKVREILDVAA
jgi:PAS domain S-box-containing protein